MRRTFFGTTVALSSMAVATAVMIPLRSHLSIATTALILVVPVVIGVATGGFVAGIISVGAGFLVYDFFFIPPYRTLWVGAPQNWVALGVYVVVLVPVSQVVASMNSAKAEARRQGREIRELFEISHLLVEDRSLDVLLSSVVTTLAEVFSADQVALILPEGEKLEVVASAGEPLSDTQLRCVLPAEGQLATVGTQTFERDGLLVVALTAVGRPVGLLVLAGVAPVKYEREPLLLFVNQIALAVERVQLREKALQARLADEVALLAKTLVTAVAHDLRAPLTSIKASSSTLVDTEFNLDPDTTRQLATLIDVQVDRLAEMVRNLLDMSRIQAGVLRPRCSVASLADLVSTVVDELAPRGHVVRVEIPEDLPLIDIDVVLISQVLVNLLENAIRHSPKFASITVRARLTEQHSIEVMVTDKGPGVSVPRRHEIFELFARRSDDAGAGLGLTIAKTFIEAHGQRIWVDDAPDGGARFCFTLPVAAKLSEESRFAENSDY